MDGVIGYILQNGPERHIMGSKMGKLMNRHELLKDF